MRSLRSLQWAHLTDHHPHPPPRPRNAAAQEGLRYEVRVIAQLEAIFGAENVNSHRWIHFADAKEGTGYAQPDVFVLGKDRILIWESKLTQTEKALTQLRKRYGPLLSHIFHRPAVLIQVCRNLVPPEQELIGPSDFGKLKPSARDVYLWHYLGHGAPALAA